MEHEILIFDLDYVNTNIEEHSWYVGNMDREKATQSLSLFPLGTFLVRCRVNMAEPNYAISLKTGHTDVKHMKILSNLNDEYYLSDSRKFKSVVELVSYFSRSSLKESFSGLDCNLRFSIKDLLVVEAQHKFDPEAQSPNGTENNLLALEIGDRVVVIDKFSENTGWWKAYDATHDHLLKMGACISPQTCLTFASKVSHRT